MSSPSSLRRRGWAGFRPFLLGVVALGVVLALTVVVIRSVNGPPRVQVKHPMPGVAVAAGCPDWGSNGLYDGVGNARGGMDDRLLPGDQPTAGLVCQYTRQTSRLILSKQVPLSAAEAGTLATAIAQVDLVSGTGRTGCPMDDGSTALLLFHYESGPDVALDYHSAGCRSLDNGTISTSMAANPSFQHFQNALGAVASMT